MILKTIRLVVLCVLCMHFSGVSAQEDYLLEIGAASGGAYYLGDANDQLFKNMQATYGIFGRYRVISLLLLGNLLKSPIAIKRTLFLFRIGVSFSIVSTSNSIKASTSA